MPKKLNIIYHKILKNLDHQLNHKVPLLPSFIIKSHWITFLTLFSYSILTCGKLIIPSFIPIPWFILFPIAYTLSPDEILELILRIKSLQLFTLKSSSYFYLEW